MGSSCFLLQSIQPSRNRFADSVPSQLLPVLAEMTVRDDPNYRGFEQVRALPPWIMAAIARESIVRGNEGRTQHATPDDILQLARLHHEVFVEPTRQSLTAIAGLLMHEQMWWQISLFEEQARTLSLFDDPAYGDVFPWEDVLGMTLVDAVKAAFLVGLVVNRNAGRWDESVLDAFYSDPRVEAHISRARVVQTAKLLTITIDDFRSMGRKWDERPDRDPELAKHPLNPLMGYPLVDLGADRYCCAHRPAGLACLVAERALRKRSAGLGEANSPTCWANDTSSTSAHYCATWLMIFTARSDTEKVVGSRASTGYG